MQTIQTSHLSGGTGPRTWSLARHPRHVVCAGVITPAVPVLAHVPMAGGQKDQTKDHFCRPVLWTTLLSTSLIAPIIPPAQETSAAASLSPGNGPILYVLRVQVMAPLLTGLHQFKATSDWVL